MKFINVDAIKDETNPGAKSDILRLEVTYIHVIKEIHSCLNVFFQIIYQFGGIYLDTDSVCVRQFPSILRRSFVTHVFGGYNNLCNCVFGLARHSGLLRFSLETLRRSWAMPGHRDRDVPGKTGPTFLTSMFVSL